jgi:hypothetical protein
VPQLDPLLGDFAPAAEAEDDGLKLFEGLDNLLEAETSLLGMGDAHNLDIFDDLSHILSA